ncbi:lactococcin 972 family bacteriocin [Dactylosporangium sp. NPDC051484]|uniref:lactococcin 972 family bacteriocin n=1 Tax=Dactylosporangium sp. NPDC051484 TaxID=3154942 RepID=UPI00344D88B8
MKRTVKLALAGVALSAAVTGVVAEPAQAWVSVGTHTQYPSEGGTWQYGFWDVKVRSHYTVNRCHGSTVIRYIDGSETSRSRSIDTASGQKSIAEISTINSPGLEASYYYRTC